MYKRNANIVFGIIIFLSLLQLSIIIELIPVSDTIKNNSVLIYVFLIVAGTFAMSKFVALLSSKKPKEVVKIIYKKFEENEADENIIEKKASEKIDRIASSVLLELDEIKTAEKFSEVLLRNFAKSFEIVQGIVFIYNKEKNNFTTSNTYAFYQTETSKTFEEGEGITGQVAKNKKFLYIDNVPKNYITVLSGLGDGSPKYLAFLPIVHEDKTIAVIEFASFVKLPSQTEKIFNLIAEKLTPYFVKFV